MTLIIAGHNLIEDISSQIFKKSESSTKKPATLSAEGLFVLADSSITDPSSSGQKVILGGFRKIYPVAIKVWQPDFSGLYFTGYSSTYYESECFIAIAGSTLTAQHVLNLISTHLSDIRISYHYPDGENKPGKYLIQRHCQKNSLEDGRGIDQWDERMFTNSHYKNIITGDAIAEIVEYSINEALNSAKKYKLSQKEFNAMQTDFALGIYCPTHKKHQLFSFRMSNRMNVDGLFEVFAEKEEIMENDIVVLGMRAHFESAAKATFLTSIQNGEPVAKNLFDFLNGAIDNVKKSGSFSIDRPSVHKEFFEGKLDLKQQAR